MIISKPDDGTGHLYHVVNLLGLTVHAYRSKAAAARAMEGDQRLFTQVEKTGEWVGETPTSVYGVTV